MESKTNIKQKQPDLWVGLSIVVFLVFLGWLGVWQLQNPPAIISETAPVEVFSAGRAFEYLRMIAAEPRVPGTENHRIVREEMVDELTRLGWEVEVQQVTSLHPDRRSVPFRAATISNVLARLKGTDSAGAVLLMAHYDSVPTSPGAGDDGIGVAALMETARALQAGEPLKNDLIILLTDAEELGMLGARAFLEEHSWKEEVRLVFNFDNQGPHGHVYMFETSPKNRQLIREFASAVPYPLASSLSETIYRLLPFANDLALFKEKGYPALGFSVISDISKYHSALDRLDGVDLGTLQHQGSYALALARHFGNGSLEVGAQQNGIYFNLVGWWFVHYPASWVLPLTLGVALLLLVVIGLGFWKRRLTWSGVGIALATMLANLAVVVILTLLIKNGFGLNRSTYHANNYYLGLSLLVISVTLLSLKWIQRRSRPADLAVGALLVWMVLMLVSGFILPEGSYLFTWPLLACGLVLGVWIWKDGQTPFVIVMQALGVVPGFLMLLPLVYLLFIAMTLNQPLGGVILLTLTLGLAWPLLANVARCLPRLFRSILLVGIFVLFLGAMAGYDAAHPQQTLLFYSLDADSKEAVWVTNRLDAWTDQFFGEDAEWAPLPQVFSFTRQYDFLQNPASVAEVVPPEMELLEDTVTNGIRTLKVRVYSPRRAPKLEVYLENKTPLLESTMNGRIVSRGGTLEKPLRWSWAVRYDGLPEEGFVLTFKVAQDQQLRFQVIDQTDQLPEFVETARYELPTDLMVQTSDLSNSTFVSQSFTF